jgi:Fic family protein
MIIEKRQVGRKTKYYLAHSYREGSKVHKIRNFLGSNLPKELLEDRVNKAKELIMEEINQYRIIKDPLEFEVSEKEIDFVKKIEKKIPFKISHLSEQKWAQFSELFTFNTNAIEGSELNTKEVKSILEKNEWPKEKSKMDIAEAYGVNEAIKYIRETKEELSLELIKRIHEIVFKNSKSFAGQLRKPGEEVVVKSETGEIVHEGAPQSKVLALLNELIDWYKKNKKKYPALILAAVVHNQFENIHPFADGNGRVGRVLLNNILLKNNLPPININFMNRGEYYASLQAYQKKKDIRLTLELFVKEYRSLKKLLNR